MRKIPGLHQATVVFVPESNLAWEGPRQAAAVKKSGVPNVVIMVEDHNKAGVKMNSALKKLLGDSFGPKLDKGHVLFHERLVVSYQEKHKPCDLRDQIIEQLAGWSRILTPGKDRYTLPKEQYSGKRGVGFDDHAIAIMLALVMRRIFFTSEAYRKFR